MEQKPKTPQKGAIKGIRESFDKLRKRQPSDILMEKLKPSQKEKTQPIKKIAQPKKRPDAEV